MIKPSAQDKEKMLKAALALPSPRLSKPQLADIKWIVKQRYIPPAWPIETYVRRKTFQFNWAYKTLLFTSVMTITFFITWVILQ